MCLKGKTIRASNIRALLRGKTDVKTTLLFLKVRQQYNIFGCFCTPTNMFKPH